MNRDFARDGPNQLWMTDITEHPTREGKVYCCVVLDAWSRKVVGWSIDRRPTAAMVNAALGMAVDARNPPPARWCIRTTDRNTRPVHGHEKVPAGGQLRSPLVATKSPRWWPAEVPTSH